MSHFHYLIRKRHSLFRGGGKILLCRILSRWIKWYYHCDIPYTIDINGVFFCHSGFGVVINPNVIIGEGTTIQHDVTIGSRDDIQDTRAPKIGKNVYIGAKATIIGNILIGDNAKIGAGAVVVSDVPKGATAVGVPARIIKQ